MLNSETEPAPSRTPYQWQCCKYVLVSKRLSLLTSCDMKPCAVQLACVSLVSMWFAPTRVVCVGGNVVQWSWPRHKGRHSPLIVLCLGHNARINHNPDAKLKSILKAWRITARWPNPTGHAADYEGLCVPPSDQEFYGSMCVFYDVYDVSPARVLRSTVSSVMSTMAHTPVYWSLQWSSSQTFDKKIIICEYSKISIWRSSMNMCLVKRLWSSAVIRLFIWNAYKYISFITFHLVYISDTSKNISWVLCQFIIYVTEKLFVQCQLSYISMERNYISMSKDIISICFISLSSISDFHKMSFTRNNYLVVI